MYRVNPNISKDNRLLTQFTFSKLDNLTIYENR